jgi:iron(III) transport system permease protein
MQQAGQIRQAQKASLTQNLTRRINEFRLIAQDNVLMMGLLIATIFIFLFILLPLGRVIIQGFFLQLPLTDAQTMPSMLSLEYYTDYLQTIVSTFDLEYFTRYLDPVHSTHARTVLVATLSMGLQTALYGTVLGFIFAYTAVRCQIPMPRVFHVFALLPTISPPFAIAIATILLFGRNGLITKQFLGMQFAVGNNDIYGLDGLIFVQTITFFSIPYLIIRAMLERLDPATEEAALSMGASKFHIFRTITLPLLIPGIAGSFLLLFVESLADLGNPLLLGGNATVLASEIFLAVAGEYNQQKAAALSLVLLAPTVALFMTQNYIVKKRSYISVTGKPTGGQLLVKEPLIRWSFIAASSLALVMVIALYASILGGSMTRLWGVDYSIDFQHYRIVFTQGLEAIIDTTYLSAIATPVAGLMGMLIAFITIRKTFSGKEALDMFSNMGGAVPGVILGIGYIIAFIQPPWWAWLLVLTVLALYLSSAAAKAPLTRLLIFGGSISLGWLLALLPGEAGSKAMLSFAEWQYTLTAIVLVAAVLAWWGAETIGQRWLVAGPLVGIAIYLGIYDLVGQWLRSLTTWSRTLPGVQWPKVVSSLADQLAVVFQLPHALLGLTFITIIIFLMIKIGKRARTPVAFLMLTTSMALALVGQPMALIGTSYIILFAFAVRSLPASVRAGVAALQQIDASIEEASANLGADAQYTFRRVTLPLILPAFIAGLIFSFARHMTSLSAIIFLSTGKWRILTLEILDSVERRGLSVAAAYSVVLIVIVLIGIGLTYLILSRTLGSSGQRVDFDI